MGWLNSYSQISPERAALKNLARHKWEKVNVQMKKAIRKDSLNSIAPYIMAQYFFAPENPNFQVDSAYTSIMRSMLNYQLSSIKTRDRLKKFPLDSMILVRYRERIDSAAFMRAKQTNSVVGYDYFLTAFPLAAEQGDAVLLRNEVAYEDVLKLNTYLDFKRYMEKYPDAKRYGQAKANYERLLYEDKTRDKKLVSYRNFIAEYPETPYRQELDKRIFEIFVASGSVESFQQYLELYPHTIHAAKAKAILFHLLKEEQRLTSIPFLQSDSLHNVLRLEQNYLVPFLHNGRFGFMDQEGIETLTSQAEDISKDYVCGNVTEDILVLPEGIVARNGSVIYAGEILSVEDIGFGFLIIEKETGREVIHKAGFSAGGDSIEDARILQGKLLSLKRNNRWSIWTFTGLPLLDSSLDDVIVLGSNIVLLQDSKYRISTAASLAGLADQNELQVSDMYDEVKPWSDNLVWCRSGNLQGVLDADLNICIPFENQVLSETFCGVMARHQDQVTLRQDDKLHTYRDVLLNKPWAAVQVKEHWQLTRPLDKFKSLPYDTIQFAGPFAIGVKGDTLTAHISAARKIEIKQPGQFAFIPGQDSAVYLLLDQGGKKTVFDQKGRKLFTVTYDKIQHGGNETFIVSVKEKKGLINSAGKVLLPVEYDAIGTAKDGVVSLLKAMKFGLYNIRSKKLIKPAYLKNLTVYNRESVVAYKDGAFGFVGWDGKPISDFGFSEVQRWSDSVAFVKKNFQWMLYEVSTKRILQDKIKGYKLIQDSAEGKLAILHQDNKYGVLHSKRGFIIPPTFSDIVNVGSSEMPMYFTEKHVEEASIFVVIYYNHEGKMLRKEVYEHEDYEKIYCSGSK